MDYYDFQPPVMDTELPRRKGKWRIFVAVILTALALAAAGLLVYNNILSSQPSTDITVTSVCLSDDRIELSGSFNGFAGLNRHSYAVDEDIVVINLYPALPIAGARRDFSIELTDDFSGISEINISDGRNSLVVWTYGQPAQSAAGSQ